jgi:hypothetical protein
MYCVGSRQSKVIPLAIHAQAEPVEVINAAVQEVRIVEEKDFQKMAVDKGMARERVQMKKKLAEPP